jgi:hypothetical protein
MLDVMRFLTTALRILLSCPRQPLSFMLISLDVHPLCVILCLLDSGYGWKCRSPFLPPFTTHSALAFLLAAVDRYDSAQCTFCCCSHNVLVP